LWQELTHQRRFAGRTRVWPVIAIVAVGGLVSLIYYTWQVGMGYEAMQLALIVTWLGQIAVGARAIIAGTALFSREHSGQTWDALVLTGVSARTILLGKWRAALRAVGGPMLLLGTLRLALLPVYTLGITKIYALYFNARVRNNSGSVGYGIDWPDFQWLPWAWFLAVGLTVALTMLEVLACTALGALASAVTRRTIYAAMLAFGLRFLPVFLFAGTIVYQLRGRPFWQWWGRLEFSLADAGTSALMQLAFPLMPWTRGDHAAALPGLIAALLMLTAILGASLLITRTIIRRDGALAQPSKPGLSY
jgi:hypothetical protein